MNPGYGRRPEPHAAGSSGWALATVGAQAYAPLAPPSPFSVEAARDDDAGLFQDARTGFSHLLPGRPSLPMPRALDPRDPRDPREPPADVVVHLQDVPVTVRYKLEAPSVHASSAAELARLTAERFASWRAQAPVNVELANPTWLVGWGSEAAAVASYDVVARTPAPSSPSHTSPPHPPSDLTPAAHGDTRPVADGDTREDLFVLVRQGMVYLVTWTYPRGFADDPAYASFASVAEATMIWDPLRWEQRGRIWPESAFVGPGIHAQPQPRYNEAARWLSRVALADDERAHLLGVLSKIVGNAGAPWAPLRADVLEGHRSALLSSLRHPELRTFVDGVFFEVRTGHDLRGLAVVLGRALEARPSPTMRR